MRHASGLAAAGLCICAAPLEAAGTQSFAIPPGRLGNALVRFGQQAGVTIGVTDAALASRATRGVRGRHATRVALSRLLAGTGASFVFIDAQTVRVFAAPVARKSRPRPVRQPRAIPRPAPVAAPRPTPPPVVEDVPQQEIVVTASKQRTPLDRYAGTVSVLELDPDKTAREASRGTAAIVSRLPMIGSTSLGPGRDKLFIRGVADSSFNGPSQATVGQYLGDVRLTYNAPDPDLNLYDIERVEVLEGPQGTLYGTGSIGGIIRLVPGAPDPGGWAGSLSAGGTTTRRGGAGGDVAAMLNAPIADDRIAIRGVGYWTLDPGYIDDPSRGLTDINRTSSFGGRVALRADPGDDWRVTLGAALQNISSRDGQYALRGQPELTRASRLPQPFDNDYRLAYLEVAKAWRGAELSSTTAVVRHETDTVFDATIPPDAATPRLFEEDIAITLLSHETRLSGASGRRSWVAGFSGVYDISRVRRRLGDPAAPVPITGVRNENAEAALFGQVTLPVARRLAATLGGRLTYSRAVGELLDKAVNEPAEPKRSTVRASPTVALSWAAADRLLVFVHFQQGFRAGGLAVAPNGTAADSQRFEADTLKIYEFGMRLGRTGKDRFAASATISYASWSDIQADLVDTAGLPFTTNLGNGRIYGLEAQMTWRPRSGLTLEGAVFLNDTALSDPAPDYRLADERELPNIAKSGGRVAISYKAPLARAMSLTLDASVRYVGESQLGIGAPLDVEQGEFVEAAAGGRLSFGRFGISLDISNIGDVRGNRFAYGNPFGIAARDQVTPLRPRSIRLGIDTRF